MAEFFNRIGHYPTFRAVRSIQLLGGTVELLPQHPTQRVLKRLVAALNVFPQSLVNQ